MARLAADVDRYWGNRLIGFQPPGTGRGGILTFRGLYVGIYRVGSRAIHAQPHALDPYVDLARYPPCVRRSEPAPESIWWPVAVPLYAQELLVYNEQLGWPKPDRVRAVNNAMFEARSA